VVAVRTKTLPVLSYDADLEVLRMLDDRRDELSKAKAQSVNRLHPLLSKLVPGQSNNEITALQAKRSLPRCGPATRSARHVKGSRSGSSPKWSRSRRR
jgi:hypothetical protein